MTVVSGSLEDWVERLPSIVVRFKADSLIDRGLKSCYSPLPSLTGPLTVLPAQAALRRAAEDPTELPVSGRELIHSERTGLFTLTKLRSKRRS